MEPESTWVQHAIAQGLAHRPEDEGAPGRVIKALLRNGLVIVSADDLARVSAPYPGRGRETEQARQRLVEAAKCRCEMIHGHCYAISCHCPLHFNEVSTV